MKQILILISTVLVLFSFFGCADKEMGIFYSIEEERELEDNSIPNGSYIGSMAFLDDSYYAAAGTLFSVGDTDNFNYHTGDGTTKWSEVEGTPANTLCHSIATIDGTLYGIFSTKNASGDDSAASRLYYQDGSTWTAITGDGLAADLMVSWIVANDSADEGYVLGYTTGSTSMIYHIYYFSGTLTTGTDFIDISANLMIDTVTYNITAANHFDLARDGDSSSSNYWLICGYNLFTVPVDSPSDDLTIITDTTIYSTQSGHLFKAVYHSDALGGLVVSKQDKSIYFRADDGTSWTTLDSPPYEPEDFMDITIDGTNVLLVGSSSGYYELYDEEDNSAIASGDFAEPGITAKSSTYGSLDLDEATIHSFYSHTIGSTSEEILFALTQTEGLWSNGNYDSNSSYRVWDLE